MRTFVLHDPCQGTEAGGHSRREKRYVNFGSGRGTSGLPLPNGSLADLSRIDVAWLVPNDAQRGIAVNLIATHVASSLRFELTVGSQSRIPLRLLRITVPELGSIGTQAKLHRPFVYEFFRHRPEPFGRLWDCPLIVSTLHRPNCRVENRFVRSIVVSIGASYGAAATVSSE
jgi:hypothetical protein